MGVRRAMNVANKPEFKKKKAEKPIRSQELLDFEQYVGENFTLMKEAADITQAANKNWRSYRCFKF